MYLDTILGSDVVNPNGCRVPVTWCEAWDSGAVCGRAHPCMQPSTALARLPPDYTRSFTILDRFTAAHARNRVTGSCTVAQRAYSKGHELAVHTYTHPRK